MSGKCVADSALSFFALRVRIHIDKSKVALPSSMSVSSRGTNSAALSTVSAGGPPWTQLVHHRPEWGRLRRQQPPLTPYLPRRRGQAPGLGTHLLGRKRRRRTSQSPVGRRRLCSCRLVRGTGRTPILTGTVDHRKDSRRSPEGDLPQSSRGPAGRRLAATGSSLPSLGGSTYGGYA